MKINDYTFEEAQNALDEAFEIMNPVEETNAEWLEGIRWVNAARPLTREEAHRLIEQSERAQELEKYCEVIEKDKIFFYGEKFALQNEIKRLRKALAFYAKKENYNVNVTNQWEPLILINQDHGEKARQALERDSNE